LKLPGLQYHSPYTFTPRQRLRLAFLPPAIAYSLRSIYATCTVEVRGGEYYEDTLAREGHGILAFWHETLGMAAAHYRNKNYHTLTSYSFDGEMAARVISWFNEEAVRGSSSRGGSEGLRQLELAIRQVPCIGITLDGPRGPRRESKAGAAVLAARTGCTILPNAFAAEPCWRLRKSWDKFIVPKPFSRIVCAYGEPIPAPDTQDEDAVEAVRQVLEGRLLALQEDVEQSLGQAS